MRTNTATNSPDRLRLCVQAAYRIEALANLLHRNASNDSDEDPFAVEEVSSSIAALAAIVMSAAGDENDPPGEIARRLFRDHRAMAWEAPSEGEREQQATSDDPPAVEQGAPATIDDLLGESADSLWDAAALLQSLQARVAEMESEGSIHIDQRVEIGRGMRVAQGLIEREASKLPDLGWAPQGARQ